MNLAEVEAVKEQIRAAPTGMATAAMNERGDKPLRFGLGTGLTEKEDEYRVAIRLTTLEQEQRFRELFAQLIDENAGNIDIKVVGEGSLLQSALPQEADCDPETPPPLAAAPLSLQIGSRVRHVNGRSGTLAFFARLDGKMGFVSCNHVIARRDRAEEGDAIVAADTGERIGCLRAIEELGGQNPRADCAFAVLCDQKLTPKSPGQTGRFQLKRGAPAVKQYMPVYKIGAESGVTEGRISVVKVEWEIDYGRFFAKFTDLIEIESVEQDRARSFTPLAVDGDSGAIVVTKKGDFPIGVLFYKTPGGPGNSGMVYANPLPAIETALGLTMAF